MNEPRVKICGITRREDADIAVRCGADALGFVFWPDSPRAVSVTAARAIALAIPALVSRVGVFVNADPDEVRAIVDAVGLDAVQLHGDESIDAYRGMRARLIKAVMIATDADFAHAVAAPADVTLLVDALDRDKRGGTGRTADWDRAEALARRRPIILAGGLTADNVGVAIAGVRPWAVDVSSGVETTPGVKSADRLERFFAAVRRPAVARG